MECHRRVEPRGSYDYHSECFSTEGRLIETNKRRHKPYIYDDSPGPLPGPILAGELTPCYRREKFRPKGTKDWLLILTLKGAAFFKQPGISFEVSAHDVLIAAPGSYMHYAPIFPGGWHCYWVHFNPRPHWFGFMQLPRVGTGLVKFRLESRSAQKAVRSALKRCIEYVALQTKVAESLGYTALEEAVLLVGRERELRQDRPRLSPEIQRVVDKLEDDSAKPHSLASLAQETGLSPTRLTHRFKDETGESVIAYLLKLRLRRAAGLLHTTSKSVKEIAYETGFSSQFYFARQFRRHYGASPTSHRTEATAPH